MHRRQTSRVRDFWIYQRRFTPDMWALHVIVTKFSGTIYCYSFDIEMFADFIPRNSHYDGTCSGKVFATPDEFVQCIHDLCVKYGQLFTDEDNDQLVHEYMNIIQSF